MYVGPARLPSRPVAFALLMFWSSRETEALLAEEKIEGQLMLSVWEKTVKEFAGSWMLIEGKQCVHWHHPKSLRRTWKARKQTVA